MEFIGVSQFYETVLCFSIPLLIIQRLILACCNLDQKYGKYRLKFYQSQFLFTQEYQFDPSADKEMPVDAGIQEEMLDKKQDQSPSRRSSMIQEDKAHEIDKDNNQGSGEMRRSSKISLDLETDRQLNNVEVKKSPAKKPEKQENEEKSEEEKEKSLQIEEGQFENKGEEEIKSEEGDAEEKKETPDEQKVENKSIEKIEHPSPQKGASVANRNSHEKSEELEENMRNSQQFKKTEEANETERKETELDKINMAIGNEEEKPIEEIILSQEKQEQIEETNRIRMKYCRRIDDAFNEYIPIIMSVIVIGLVTKSIYIFSMVCFFGFAFTSLLFNYAHLLERLEDAPDRKSIFAQFNNLLSSLFILALFISYWISNEFN